MPFKLGLAALAILSLTALSANTGSKDSAKAGEAAKQPEAQVRGPIQGTAVMVDFDEQYYIEQEAIAKYLAAVEEQRKIDEYLAAIEAARVEAERQAALAAAARQRPVNTGYHPGTTVGACTGFAIPDYIIQRESGGNPSAYNPSGAYGCAQTLLSHYSSGSCRGLDPYTIEGQRACVDILSNGGTNLNPWAQTR